jgi:transglutaminase-like putative cysteine protease
MNSNLAYRASFYVMLTVATIALSVDTTDARYNMVYPVIVAVAGFVAYFTVDKTRIMALSRMAANVLAVGSIGVLYIEYNLDDSQLVRALGHWLVFLQLIKYFQPKNDKDDWFLFVLGLMQVLIGAVISQSDQVGTWLFIWAMLAIWVLGLFFLQREARRAELILGHPISEARPEGRLILDEPDGRLPATSLKTATRSDPTGDPYHGLFDLPFLAAAARVMVTTLALGGVIFLFMPRQVGATRSQGPRGSAKHLTGFDEEVQLGQLGEILENDSVVMSVEFTDEEGNPSEPGGEPLWRGTTMAQYIKGRWHRQRQEPVSFPVRLPRTSRILRQQIRLEATDSATLFGIRPIVDVSAGYRLPPYFNQLDGTIFRPESRSGIYNYIVVSDADSTHLQRYEKPLDFFRTEQLLNIPLDLRPRFRALSERVLGDIPAENIEARARTLEAYLRDSGEFGYTLQMDVVDSSLDPVEDFLVNRKEGHCEYFASALALLLRSIDIPSRVVNGFKGGDWNTLTQAMYVRQKHAHSWVEAYMGIDPKTHLARWLTLDPTPGSAREASVERVGGLSSRFRMLTDTIRHIWVFYIVGYDAERQNRLLYNPIRQLIQDVRAGYAEIGSVLRRGLRLFQFENIGALFSVRGFFVSFFLLTALVGLVKSLIWVGRRVVRWLRGPEIDPAARNAGIRFYRRLAQTLAEFDIRRTPAETQGEFARRAMLFLGARGPEAQPVAEVPRHVVDAFYRVRFGQIDLDPETLESLEQQLDALEARLKEA